MSIESLTQYVPDILASHYPGLKYRYIEGIVHSIYGISELHPKLERTLKPKERQSLLEDEVSELKFVTLEIERGQTFHYQSFYVVVPKDNIPEKGDKRSLFVERFDTKYLVMVNENEDRNPYDVNHAWLPQYFQFKK